MRSSKPEHRRFEARIFGERLSDEDVIPTNHVSTGLKRSPLVLDKERSVAKAAYVVFPRPKDLNRTLMLCSFENVRSFGGHVSVWCPATTETSRRQKGDYLNLIQLQAQDGCCRLLVGARHL